MKVQAVIGANWGDEGKGKLTDYLCANSEYNTIVCRYSGGANAGHTVEVGDKRHVFGHFGAGTIAGCPTYLSEDFVVNPYLFMLEYRELQQKGIAVPMVFIHPKARITTHMDMWINRALEQSRGKNRHGSVGVGIYETILRQQREPLTYGDLQAPYEWPNSFLRIALGYFPDRLKELGLIDPDLDDDLLLARTKEEIDFLKDHTEVARLAHLQNEFEQVIFEGSQGIALDQGRTWDLPHLTPANTGCKNIAKETNALRVHGTIRLHYASRTYLTRHGAGPLPGEGTEELAGYKKFTDSFAYETNRMNTYQEHFRYAPFDQNVLMEHLRYDSQSYDLFMDKVSATVSFMCTDQYPIKMEPIMPFVSYVGTGRFRDNMECYSLPRTMRAL